MKKYLLCAALLLVLNACTKRPDESQKTTDSTISTTSAATSTASRQCFQQVTGRDSVLAHLTIVDGRVTGRLAVLPAEKDRADGSITGTMTGNQIRADWQRSGEGVTQVYAVHFTLVGDSLSWREGERVEKQGRWVLADSTGNFRYVLGRVTCP